MGRYESCKHFDALYDATENCFPTVDRQNACTILREVILAPDDYVVEFGGNTFGKTDIMQKLIKELALSCVYETPEKTHYDILENAANIMKHMNDGFVSEEDYCERSDFLDMTERYEFTLFTAYCLLRIVDSEDISRLDELKLNVTRLREIRDLILNYTRDAVNVEIDRDEYERAKPIYRMLKSLQSLGYDYNFSPRERASLDIDHEDDTDLSDSFNAENWLKRIMLLELRLEVITPVDSVPADAPLQREETSGYNSPAPSREELISDKIALLRGTYNKRRFDKDRFLVLEKAKASSSGDDNIN